MRAIIKIVSFEKIYFIDRIYLILVNILWEECLLGLMPDSPLLLSSLIQHADKYHGKREIVSRLSNGKIVRSNYAETHKRSKKLAQALIKLNVIKGDMIATMAWSNTRHYELFYGVPGIGAICHTINPRLFIDQIIYIIKDAKDKFIFLELDFIPILSQIVDEIEDVEGLVFLCDSHEMPDHNFSLPVYCYEDLLEDNDGDFAWPLFDEMTASSLCYTSGTTGNPKGVLYAHRSNILHSLAAAAPDVMSISANDIVMPIAPMFHANAWGLPYVATMVGSKIVLPGKLLDGKNVYELIQKEKVTFTAAVPTIWLMLFEYLEKTSNKIPSLDRCVVGGSACPKFMIEKFRDIYSVEVIHAWGMTETSPLGTINKSLPEHVNLNRIEKDSISIKQGRPMYGIELKITDDDGRILPNDGLSYGNLWVKGPWVCTGYLNINNSEVHTRDNWFLTGDVATLDKDGFMLITDRAKDVIKSGGEWISSIEIENIAAGHPGIVEAAVIGVSHKKWDERPLLILVRNKKTEVSKDIILDYLKDKIAKWWMPDDAIFVDNLPHTATGKLKKIELKEKYIDYLIKNQVS